VLAVRLSVFQFYGKHFHAVVRCRLGALDSPCDGTDLDRLNAHLLGLQPLDGGFDLVPFTVEFEADDADLVRDAGLADVCCGVFAVVGADFFLAAIKGECRIRNEE
jgi:hypothetical protein